MNARDYSPIVPAIPDLRQKADVPSVSLMYQAMDDTMNFKYVPRPTDRHIGAAVTELFEAQETKRGDWAPTARESAVIEFVESVDKRASELVLEDRPQPTPNAKWVGIAIDAIAALQSILALTEGNASASLHLKVSAVAAPVLKSAGVR